MYVHHRCIYHHRVSPLQSPSSLLLLSLWYAKVSRLVSCHAVVWCYLASSHSMVWCAVVLPHLVSQYGVVWCYLISPQSVMRCVLSHLVSQCGVVLSHLVSSGRLMLQCSAVCRCRLTSCAHVQRSVVWYCFVLSGCLTLCAVWCVSSSRLRLCGVVWCGVVLSRLIWSSHVVCGVVCLIWSSHVVCDVVCFIRSSHVVRCCAAVVLCTGVAQRWCHGRSSCGEAVYEPLSLPASFVAIVPSSLLCTLTNGDKDGDTRTAQRRFTQNSNAVHKTMTIATQSERHTDDDDDDNAQR